MATSKNGNNGGLNIILDPIFNSRIRLAIISILSSAEQCSFTEIVNKLKATAGNVNVQIKKLEKAGYIIVKREFSNNYPSTLCRITDAGRRAILEYDEAISKIIYLGKTISD